jgi:5-methylcytosine-specific restriction endonuclease McrA
VSATNRPRVNRHRGGRPYRRLAQRLRREGVVCWLCGLPIDVELRTPHPLSFSLDHLVPLSMGGDVASPSNVAPAHRICNMKRGTGRGRPKTEGDRSAGW